MRFFCCCYRDKRSVSPWEFGSRCLTGRFPCQRKENRASSHVYLLISLRNLGSGLNLNQLLVYKITRLFLTKVPK